MKKQTIATLLNFITDNVVIGVMDSKGYTTNFLIDVTSIPNNFIEATEVNRIESYSINHYTTSVRLIVEDDSNNAICNYLETLEDVEEV